MATILFYIALALLVVGTVISVLTKNRNAKTVSFILMFIGSLGLILYLTDSSKLSTFLDEHRMFVKSLLYTSAVTALILSIFNLYRKIFPGSHESHYLEEITVGAFHGDVLVAPFVIDKWVKDVKDDRKKGKEVYYKCLRGLQGFSSVIFPILVPIIITAGLYVSSSFQIEVAGINVLQMVTYGLTAIMTLMVIIYWLVALTKHRYRALPGHELHIYFGKKLLFIKKPEDGSILVPPIFFRAVQVKKYFIVECSAKGMSGHQLNADPSLPSRQVKAKISLSVEILDTALLLDEFSEEALEEEIINMVKDAFLDTIGDKTSDVIQRDPNNLTKEIKQSLNRKLGKRRAAKNLQVNLVEMPKLKIAA